MIDDQWINHIPNQILVNSISDGFIILNNEDQIVFINNEFITMLGFAENELIGQNVTNFLNPDSAKVLEDARKTASENQPAKLDIYWTSFDGKQICTEASVFLLEQFGKDQRGHYIFVTEKDESRKELITEQPVDSCRIILDLVPDGIVIVNNRGKITYCNAATSKFTGLPREEIIGKRFTKFSPLRFQDIPKFTKLFASMLRGKMPQPFEVEWQHSDGSTLASEVCVSEMKMENGKKEIIAIARDITARQQIEQSLRESEEKYRILVEQSPLGIVIGQASPIHMAFVNSAFARIMGYTLKELASLAPQKIRELVHPEDQAKFFGSFENKLKDKSGLQGYEIRGIRKDGTEVWLHVAGSHILYNGQPAVQSTFADITERKKVEEDLKKTVERSMLYLDILGHDMRNHLQAVIMGTDLIRNAERNTDLSSILDYIDEIVSRAQNLIEKVHATSDLFTVPLSEVSINGVIESCLVELQKNHPHIRIEKKYSIRNAVVNADLYIHNLFMNILENAIHHNPNENQQIWIELQELEDGYEIIIADNGPGIPDDKKEDLFDRNRRFGGVGVHQAKQILEKYQGRIEVQDRIEGDSSQGVKFCIWLPKTK